MVSQSLYINELTHSVFSFPGAFILQFLVLASLMRPLSFYEQLYAEELKAIKFRKSESKLLQKIENRKLQHSTSLAFPNRDGGVEQLSVNELQVCKFLLSTLKNATRVCNIDITINTILQHLCRLD